MQNRRAGTVRRADSLSTFSLPSSVYRLSSAPGIKVVPMQDGVEAEEEGAVRLPAPEGADAEHHDVAVADGCIDDLRLVGKRLATGERAGEQHLGRVGREAQDGARPRVARGGAGRSVAASRGACSP